MTGIKNRYFSVIAIALVITICIWQIVKYKLVNKNVLKLSKETNGGLYDFKYENLVLDEVTGMLSVKNVVIAPDSMAYQKLLTEQRIPKAVVSLKIASLNVFHLKTPRALLNKQIDGDEIAVSNADINLTFEDFFGDSIMYNPGTDISSQLLQKFVKIKMGNIQLSHSHLVIADKKTKSVLLEVKDISFLLSDLLIDSNTHRENDRLLFSRNMEFNCTGLSWPSKNKKYRVDIGQIHFNSLHNNLTINRLELLPMLSEKAFANSFLYQQDRYEIHLENLVLSGINRGNLWHKKLVADSFLVNKSAFKIYRDLSYPRDTLSRVGKYPHQLLQQLTVPIFIRDIALHDAFIEYKEKNKKSGTAGKLQFYNVLAKLSNVTNIPEAIDSNKNCLLDFKADFLNRTPIQAHLKMVLKEPRGLFTIRGNMGAIPAVSLNRLSMPMGLLRFNDGQISKMNFNFTGTDAAATGTVLILYKDLNISMLQKKSGSVAYRSKFVPSLLANMLVKNDNPSKKEPARTAMVNYKRDVNKSFFNLVWKSIFTGVKQTAGIK